MLKKNALGEHHQEEQDMLRYLRELSDNDAFDVTIVKSIAKRFLVKLNERSEILNAIRVDLVDPRSSNTKMQRLEASP